MQKWMILLFFFLIGISFLPAKLAVQFSRESNRIVVITRFTLGVFSIRINLVNPVTKTIWHLATNRFWKKRPPRGLAAHEVNWVRLFLRINHIKSILGPVFNCTNRLFIKIAAPIRLSRLNLITELSLQDAAQTAYATGLVWSFFGVLYNRLQTLFIIKPAHNRIAVIPNFERENFLRLDYSCIFAFRLGHIIIIIYQIFRSSGEISRLLRRVSQ